MKARSFPERQYLLASFFLATALFITDLFLPLGIAWGIMYLPLVIMSLWAPRRGYVFGMAIVASLLTLSGLFIPFKQTGAILWMGYTNRTISLLAIWMTAVIAHAFRKRELTFRSELESRIEERTSELKTLNKNLLGEMEERREAQEMIRVEHRESELLIASIQSILIRIGGNGLIRMWSREAEKIFGLKSGDVTGKELFQLGMVWNHAIVKTGVERCERERRTIRIDDVAFVRAEDGKEGLLGVSITPVTGEGSMWDGVLIHAADITKRKAMEVELVHARKLESLGQLAAGIAHEINTPVQYIGDNARFLLTAFNDIFTALARCEDAARAVENGDDARPLARMALESAAEHDIEYLREEIPKAIEQSISGVERVTDIVRAMKEFAHPGSREKTLVDINRLAQNAITVSRSEWKYVADVAAELDPSLPFVPLIPGDMSQVLLNLLVNAAHAISETSCAGENGKGAITVSTRLNGGFVEIRVADTGAGIRQDIRHKIFDPFFTTKEVGKGTGQGLAIVHSIVVDRHGGNIGLESEVGKGTTFIIQLPLKDDRKHKPGESDTDERKTVTRLTAFRG